MRRTTLGGLAVLLILSLCCCSGAKKADVMVKRYLPTGVVPGERIVLLLGAPSTGNPADNSGVSEQSVAEALRSAVREEHPGMEFVAADEFRRGVFPERNPAHSGYTVEELVAAFKEAEGRARVERLGVRYVVVFREHTSRGETRYQSSVSAGTVGMYWLKWTRLWAAVLDARAGARAGEIEALSLGEANWCLFPPFPIKLGSTESEARNALGTSLSRFLEGKEDVGSGDGGTER